MKIERVLYLTAKNDLLASEILYRKKKYQQAMFLFQQGVEKANKVLGLLEGVIKPEELQAVGHDSTKLYKKNILVRKANVDNIVMMARDYPKIKKHQYYKQIRDHAEDIKKGEQFLQGLQKDTLLKLRRDDLYYCLDQMWDTYYLDPQVPENIDIEELLNYHYSFFEAIAPEAAIKEKTELETMLQDPNNRKEFMDGVRVLIDRALDVAFVNCTFYFSAIVTLPHAMKARYPETDMSFNPLTFYNRKLPLVDLQLEFIWYMKKALQMLPTFYHQELKKETSR